MTPLRQRMLQDMGIRNLAVNTQLAYVQQISAFARHFDCSPEVLGPEQVRAYQVHLLEERKLAAGSLSVVAAALRFLYKITLRRAWNDDHIPMPKRPLKLPIVLSRQGVRHEPAASCTRRIPRSPSRPRVQAASVRPPAATLRRFRRSPGGDVHHVRTRLGMGNAACVGAARPMGEPAGDGAPLRAVLQCEGAAYRRAAPGLASPPIPPSRPLPVPRRGDHAPARCRPTPAIGHGFAAPDVRHALRPVRWPPACGPTSRCASTALMSTSSTAC